MKSAIAWVVLVGLAAGAGAYGMQVYRRAEDAATYEQRLASLKQDFLRKSTGLQLVDDEQYPREVGVALARYTRELEQLGRDFPALFDVERKRAEVAAKVEAGTMDEIQKAQRDERIDFTLALFNTMRSGQYRPLYSAVDNTFRFDIFDMRPAKIAGQNRIQLSFVHWGAFGEVSYSLIEGKFGGNAPKSGAPIAIPKLVGEGQPPSLQIEPERWVEEFIPGVQIGYYDFPLMPPTATDITLRFSFDIRTVGGSNVPVNLTFPPIPIPDAWKVGNEEQWAAQEQYATEDELRAEGAID